MKILKICTFILLFVLFSVNAFCQFTNVGFWLAKNSPRFRDVNGVSISNNRYLIGVGGNETNDAITTIINSSDGGRNWGLAKDSVNAWLKGVAFADNNLGIAAGNSGLIMRTLDGGQTWTSVALDSSVSSRTLNAVCFTSASTGFIVGGNQYSDSIQTILKTIDSGMHWNVILDQPGYWLRKVNFPDPLHGYAVGDRGMVLKTTDGGQHWNLLTLIGNTTQRQYNSVFFTDSLHGVIIGGNPSLDSIQTILKTNDGGANWGIVSDNRGPMLNDVNFYSSQEGMAVGDYGAFLHTANGGGSWESIALPDTINDARNLRCVGFKDARFGIAAGQYGKILIFNDTTFSMPSAQTGIVWITTDGKVLLTGTVNPNGNTTDVVFEYGETTDLGSHFAANQVSGNDTSGIQVSVEISGLNLQKLYYFRIKVSNPVGIAYSQVQSFYPGLSVPVGSVIILSEGKVKLKGMVEPKGSPTNVFFEYGQTTLLGLSVPADEGTVNDTGKVAVSVELSGLNPEKMYYFRIKSSSAIGIVYSPLQNFFPGYSVPNWSFELWDTTIVQNLTGWNTGSSVTRITSYDGSSAVQLHSDSNGPGVVFYGTPSGSVLVGGIPFTDRPDSIYGYFRYAISIGDTALIFLNLKKNNQSVAYQVFKIAGSSANQFRRLSFPVHYISGENPDSMILACISSNYFGGHNDTSSLIALDNLSFYNSASGIPNGDFEQWQYKNYIKPTGWSSGYSSPDENMDSVIRPTQESYEGKYAVEIRNNVVKKFYGSLTTAQGKVIFTDRPSFKVFARHRNVSLFVKYFPEMEDTLFIQVSFFLNSKYVGTANIDIGTAMPEYTNFVIPVNYTNDSIVPDSATFRIGMHNRNMPYPQTNSRAIIDAITFDGISTLLNPVMVNNLPNEIRIYPNPSVGLVNLNIYGNKSDLNSIRLYSMEGRLLKSFEPDGSVDYSNNPLVLDISNCPNGMYLLELSFMNQDKKYQKIIVEK
jgi:photosystem II stability/assembly factor-like uncharacterized protein